MLFLPDRIFIVLCCLTSDVCLLYNFGNVLLYRQNVYLWLYIFGMEVNIISKILIIIKIKRNILGYGK